jgi:hypothetical protein
VSKAAILKIGCRKKRLLFTELITISMVKPDLKRNPCRVSLSGSGVVAPTRVFGVTPVQPPMRNFARSSPGSVLAVRFRLAGSKAIERVAANLYIQH